MMFPFLKEATKNLFSKPSTVMFPKVDVAAKPGYRGRIAYDAEKCTGCGMCQKVCSPGAITSTTEPTEGGELVTMEFDMASCTFCGMCQDFCTDKAITLTEDYHMVALHGAEIVTRGTRFKKKETGVVTLGDACVYCSLCMMKCPSGAITVDRKAKTWALEPEKCTHCGICIKTCPKKTLSFQEPTE